MLLGYTSPVLWEWLDGDQPLPASSSAQGMQSYSATDNQIQNCPPDGKMLFSWVSAMTLCLGVFLLKAPRKVWGARPVSVPWHNTSPQRSGVYPQQWGLWLHSCTAVLRCKTVQAPSEHFLMITLKRTEVSQVPGKLQNHRIIRVRDLQDHPSSPTINPKSPPHHMSKWHIQILLEHFQKGWLHHLPEQIPPILHHSLSIQSESPLAQLKAISSETFN